MGHYKDLLIQQDEQGWRFSNDYICSRCISDPYLKRFIRENASVPPCSFCRRRTPRSVTFNSLMEVIGRTVRERYNDAVNEAGWDHEDGWFGDVFDTDDLVRYHLEPSEREDVMQAIIESLGVDREWVHRNMYSLTGSERYIASWEEFSSTVKHRTRYFFDLVDDGDELSETIPVPRMLDELRDIVEGAGLQRSLPADTEIFRVRPQERSEACDNWQTLGSPPDNVAQANRMSAAGISVFYGAFDMRTARAEVSAGMRATDSRVLTGAAWKTTRDILVLELSQLPEVPSMYGEGDQEWRDALVFLRHFVREITKPITHDGMVHIEYVPTQILTEYFHHRAFRAAGKKLDGIVYPSAQRKNGRSIVLFASQRELDPQRFASQPPPILRLETHTIQRVRRLSSRR